MAGYDGKRGSFASTFHFRRQPGGNMRFTIGNTAAVLIFLLSALALHQTARAQSSSSSALTFNSSVSGYVFDDTRRPLSQVVVELRNEYNSVIARTRTQNSGQYRFTGLGGGRFTVYVLPLGTGYAEQSADIEIVGTDIRGRGLSANIQQDIYLHPRKVKGNETAGRGMVVFAQDVPPAASKLYVSGSEDIDRQKLDTGTRDLEAAIEAFPTYFMALQKLGYVRLAQKDFKVAQSLFERALAVNPQSYESLYGLGASQFSLNENKAAVATLQKAAVARPDSYESNFLLAMAYRVDKQYPEAEKSFKQSLKYVDAANAPDVHWNLALLYSHNMNRYGDAAKELETYLKLAPDAPNKETIKKLIQDFKEKARASE